MDTATKTRIDDAKSAYKRAVQKTVEATGDLTGNKIADKTTSVGKTKSKDKEISKTRNLHTIRKKASNYWWLKIVLTLYKNGIPKNCKPSRYNIW